MSNAFHHSSLYVGKIFHQRLSPKNHNFTYKLYMLALDVDEIAQGKKQGIFGYSWFNFLRFSEKDYLRGEPKALKERITEKVKDLQGHSDIKRIVMLVQVRCFGVYFSPANFYFCYDENNQCTQMLVEVSNTPWNERHYYLVDLSEGESAKQPNPKVFQVSPFMDLDMAYYWQVIAPKEKSERLHINIVNRKLTGDESKGEKLFEVNLNLKKKSLTNESLWAVWRQLPVMTWKVVVGIYWQALRLLLKKIPFLGYQKLNKIDAE